MSAKRHKHEFTALYWHFGQFGRQNVHVHSCFDIDCDRVMIGQTRTCEINREQFHWRETLSAAPQSQAKGEET